MMPTIGNGLWVHTVVELPEEGQLTTLLVNKCLHAKTIWNFTRKAGSEYHNKLQK